MSAILFVLIITSPNYLGTVTAFHEFTSEERCKIAGDWVLAHSRTGTTATCVRK